MTIDSSDIPAAYQKGRSTEGFLPLVAFLLGDFVGTRLFDEVWGDRIAIIAVTLAAGWAVVQRRRRGEAIGWWIPTIAAYFLVRGVAGLIWGEKVFLAFGIGVKVGLGLAALISVLIGKALAGRLAPMVLPFSEEMQQHPSYRSGMRNLTLGYAIYQLVTVGFEIWLLNRTSSGSLFLIIRLLVGWVGGFFGFFAAAFYIDRKLRGIPNFPGVMAMFEEIGLALEAQRAKS